MTNNPNFTAQSAPVATTLTDIYVMPGWSVPVLKFVTVCNRGSATTFRIGVGLMGEADAVKQYLYYDVALAANTTFLGDFDLHLNPNDVLRVYSGSGNVSFTASGILTQ